ncbi:MAG: hypothetical protein J6K53_01950 [Roseburia sp.]|nr:hypothetical protein [Roseburia sp.]
MSRIEVAVCDTDTEYRDRFVTYLIEHRAAEYAVHAFSAPELLVERSGEEKIDVAICGMGFEEAGETVVAKGIPVLFLRETMTEARTEQSRVAEAGGYCVMGTEAYQLEEAEVYQPIGAEKYQSIGTEKYQPIGAEADPSVRARSADMFRYQPIEMILHEVQALVGVRERKSLGVAAGMEIIGVYSPICHEMQMPFSMVLARMLSEKRKVLYVNLMEHSGFLEVFGLTGEYDLGDVVLAIRRKRFSDDMFLKGVYEAEGIYYIPPFDNPEDLREFSAEDYQAFLAFVEEQTDYEALVLDFGAGMREFTRVLETCTSIYCPMKKGYFYECQMRHFLKYLTREPDGEIKERLHVVQLPFSARRIRAGLDVCRQLLWSEFGDYVREYLTGGAHEDIG